MAIFTSLSRNLVVSFSLIPILYYFGFFNSFFFNLLVTIILMIICMFFLFDHQSYFIHSLVADKFSFQPDPTMDPIAGACINKKRLLRKNATTHLVFALYFDEVSLSFLV